MVIIIEMTGGLGNQISQYAMSRLLKYRYPNAHIYLNIDYYKKHKEHNGYELDKVFTNIKREYISTHNIKYHWLTIRKKIIEQQYKSGYPEDECLTALKDNETYLLKGAWHNYNYNAILVSLRNEMQFPLVDMKTAELANEIKKQNSVAVHIRGGDYVDLGLNICDNEYYMKSVEYMKTRLTNPVFYIFSDDINYLKKYDFYIGERYSIIAGNREKDSWKDMYLMSICKHNIIANSTFSYWGAMLNYNEEKIVIRPKFQAPGRETWKVDGWITI